MGVEVGVRAARTSLEQTRDRCQSRIALVIDDYYSFELSAVVGVLCRVPAVPACCWRNGTQEVGADFNR